MKLLLVFPFSIIEWNNKYEEPRIPLNITYLGAAARQAGHDVHLLDLRVEQQKRAYPVTTDLASPENTALTTLLIDTIQREGIEVVGLNCLYSGLFPVVAHLARRIKSIAPDVKIITGGIHPTIYSREILELCQGTIDYVVLGEGEETLVRLLGALETHDLAFIEHLDGLARLEEGQAVIQPKTRFIEDLDRLPFPAVDLLQVSDYFTDTSGWHSPKGLPIKTPVPVLTSRSCPCMCNFCSMHFVHGRKIRFRSPGNVLAELRMYQERYGLTYFNFTDDNLTLNKKRVLELMGMITEAGMNIQFSTENGVYVNSLDEEVLDAMSRAGLARLHLAFETGSEEMRTKVIGKNLTNAKIEEIRRILLQEKYNHIFLYGYFVIGFPEETEETLSETWRLITTFPLDNFSVFFATPFPGTRLFEQCLREKLFIDDFFYDPRLLATQVNVGQMVKGLPFIKPYRLDPARLVEFRQRALDFLRDKRSAHPGKPSSPLRMK